jgi:hypothetical protein
MRHLHRRLWDGLHLRDPLAVNGEIGTIHSAEIATAAFLRRDYMRWVVALGIESGREREHCRGTELHAEAARFTALDDD